MSVSLLDGPFPIREDLPAGKVSLQQVDFLLAGVVADLIDQEIVTAFTVETNNNSWGFRIQRGPLDMPG